MTSSPLPPDVPRASDSLADDEAYWAEAYALEPYYVAGRPYADYRPAYEHGWRAAALGGGSYEDVEPSLADDWLRTPGRNLSWDEARPAVRAAWQRATSGVAPAATLPLGEVVNVLNGLLVFNRDGSESLHAAAAQAETPVVEDVLQQGALECARAAAELEGEIRQLCGSPAEGGSVAGALQRGWTSLKAAFRPHDERGLLEDCERGAAEAVAAYADALRRPLPPALQAILVRQAEEVRRTHEEIRRLRDSAPG